MKVFGIGVGQRSIMGAIIAVLLEVLGKVAQLLGQRSVLKHPVEAKTKAAADSGVWLLVFRGKTTLRSDVQRKPIHRASGVPALSA